MNEEKKISRKEWIKNAAIIFLSIMLVLTFFSNTIMNYSLPEVATAMIEPGSIMAKIRGTGNLTAEEPYKITIQESRKIASVAVKPGDVVEKDQVLFYLEGKESTELEEAKKALEELILAYSTSILSGDISNQSYQNIQNGTIASNNEYQSRINVAKQKVEDAQATVNSLEKQISIMSATNSNINKESEKEKAVKELEKAKSNLASLESKLAEAESQSGGDASTLTADKYAKEEAFEQTKANNFESAKANLQTAMNGLAGYIESAMEVTIKGYEDIKDINEYLAELNKTYEQVQDTDSNGNSSASSKQAAAEAMHAFGKAYEETLAAQIEYENAAKLLEKVVNANSQLSSLQSSVKKAKNYVNECQAKVNSLENEISNNNTNSEQQKASLETQKIEAVEHLEKAKEELTQLLTDVGKELDLGNQNSIIREQREKIAKLQEDAVGAVIKAPIAGTITTVNKIAGENIMPEEELAIMQPE